MDTPSPDGANEDRQALIRLRTHWDCWYDVRFEHGCWTAVRLDDPSGILSAASAGQLRELMREDHAAKMTARGSRAAEGGSL